MSGAGDSLELGISLDGITAFAEEHWNLLADAVPTSGALFPVSEGERTALLQTLQNEGVTDPFKSPVL